jgi:CTP-dependent riboflavin kinase
MPRIHGRLVRGLGEAPGFTQLPWVVEQCQNKLGFTPYPGTVNLDVLPNDQAHWRELRALAGAVLSPPAGAFCDATCHLVTIDGRLAAATIEPDVAGYPEDKLELLAAVPVMETLGLRLGDVVSVEFD